MRQVTISQSQEKIDEQIGGASVLGTGALGRVFGEVCWVTVCFPASLRENGLWPRGISADLRGAATGGFGWGRPDRNGLGYGSFSRLSAPERVVASWDQRRLTSGGYRG
jgi:hypothetical protein